MENSPHLEAFRDKGEEVLYLVDPVDELWLQSLHEYGGKRLKSVGKGDGRAGQRGGEEADRGGAQGARRRSSSRLLEALQKKLQTRRQAGPPDEPADHLAGLPGRRRARLQPAAREAPAEGQGGGPKQRRILELNPKHELLEKLKARFDESADDPVLDEYAQLLFGYGVLAEGSEMPEPAKFNKAVAELMTRGL